MEVEKKHELKYKFGKVRQTPSVQVDSKTGLSYIELKLRPDENIYGCTCFKGRYREDSKLGQGTFGEVYKGIHLETQRQVAMKRIIVNAEKDLFPITAQREIAVLRKLDHKNVIKLIEMVYDYPPNNGNSGNNTPSNLQSGPSSNGKSFYMILPYMVADLSGILHNPRINLHMSDIKNMMFQLLEGINYIHCRKFMHRDIKAANILIDHNGILKLADFGLARMYYGPPPNKKFPGGAGMGAKYTSVVVTRWYRAPELVLGDKQYTTAVDIWGIGCVFAEFFEKKPILQGSSDIDQGHVIFKLLGSPKKEDWEMSRYLPGAELTHTSYPETITERFGKYLSNIGLQFLKQLLALDPYKRLTAVAAMEHPFFKEEPLPSAKLNMLSEESHEADIKRYKEEMHQAMSQKAPTAPKGHENITPINSKVELNTIRQLSATKQQNMQENPHRKDNWYKGNDFKAQKNAASNKNDYNSYPQGTRYQARNNASTTQGRYNNDLSNQNQGRYNGNKQQHNKNDISAKNESHGSNFGQKRQNPYYSNTHSDDFLENDTSSRYKRHNSGPAKDNKTANNNNYYNYNHKNNFNDTNTQEVHSNYPQKGYQKYDRQNSNYNKQNRNGTNNYYNGHTKNNINPANEEGDDRSQREGQYKNQQSGSEYHQQFQKHKNYYNKNLHQNTHQNIYNNNQHNKASAVNKNKNSDYNNDNRQWSRNETSESTGDNQEHKQNSNQERSNVKKGYQHKNGQNIADFY